MVGYPEEKYGWENSKTMNPWGTEYEVEECPRQNQYFKSLPTFVSWDGKSSPFSCSIWSLPPDPRTKMIIIYQPSVTERLMPSL